MGICFAAHALEPKVVEHVARQAAKRPKLSGREARAVLEGFGFGSPEKLGMESWEEVGESCEWNQILKFAASRNSWDLDKSLERGPGGGLIAVVGSVAALQPVHLMLKEAMDFRREEWPATLMPSDAGI